MADKTTIDGIATDGQDKATEQDPGSKSWSIPGRTDFGAGNAGIINSILINGKGFVPSHGISVKAGDIITFFGSGLGIFRAIAFLGNFNGSLQASVLKSSDSNDSLLRFSVPDLSDRLGQNGQAFLKLLVPTNSPQRFNRVITPYLVFNVKGQEKNKESGGTGSGGVRAGSQGEKDKTSSTPGLMDEVVAGALGVMAPLVPGALLNPVKKKELRKKLGDLVKSGDKKAIKKAVEEAVKLGDIEGLKELLKDVKDKNVRSIIEEGIQKFEETGAAVAPNSKLKPVIQAGSKKGDGQNSDNLDNDSIQEEQELSEENGGVEGAFVLPETLKQSADLVGEYIDKNPELIRDVNLRNEILGALSGKPEELQENFGKLSLGGRAALRSVMSAGASGQGGAVSGQLQAAMQSVGGQISLSSSGSQRVGVSGTQTTEVRSEASASGGGNVEVTGQAAGGGSSASTSVSGTVRTEVQSGGGGNVNVEQKISSQANIQGEVTGSAAGTGKVSGQESSQIKVEGTATASSAQSPGSQPQSAKTGPAMNQGQSMNAVGEHLDKNPNKIASSSPAVRNEILTALGNGNTQNLSPQANQAYQQTLQNLAQPGADVPPQVGQAAQNLVQAQNQSGSGQPEAVSAEISNAPSPEQAGTKTGPEQVGPEQKLNIDGISPKPQEAGGEGGTKPPPGVEKMLAGLKDLPAGVVSPAGPKSKAPDVKKPTGAMPLKDANATDGTQADKENGAEPGSGGTPAGETPKAGLPVPPKVDGSEPGAEPGEPAGEPGAPAGEALPGDSGQPPSQNPEYNDDSEGDDWANPYADNAAPNDENALEQEQGQAESARRAQIQAVQEPAIKAKELAERIKVITGEVNLAVNSYLEGLAGGFWVICGATFGTFALLVFLPVDFIWAFKGKIISKFLDPLLVTPELKTASDQISRQIKFNLIVKANIVLINLVALIWMALIALIIVISGCNIPASGKLSTFSMLGWGEVCKVVDLSNSSAGNGSSGGFVSQLQNSPSVSNSNSSPTVSPTPNQSGDSASSNGNSPPANGNGILTFIKSWNSTDPYPGVDWGDADPNIDPVIKQNLLELKGDFNSLNAAWQQKGYRALQPKQVYRPQDYQLHYRSVWEIFAVINGKDNTVGYQCDQISHLDSNAVKQAYSQATVQEKQTLQAEFTKHEISLGSTPAGCVSDHASGIAMDIEDQNSSVFNTALYKTLISTAQNYGMCHNIAGDQPHFALISKLPSGTNCSQP